MEEVFVGSEALRSGLLTRAKLRWNYRTIFPDVYVAKAIDVTLRQRIVGAWLWSGRRGIVSGLAAAALHGALWVPANSPIELIWSAARTPSGIVTHNEKIEQDEVVHVDGLPVTTTARTAFNLACRLPRDVAVRHLDALAQAISLCPVEALALGERYPRARGLKRLGTAVGLMDGGAASPKETWLRLLLIDEGFPRPRTQIRVTDGSNVAFIDMGWDEPMIGVEYDGKLHQTSRRRFVHDIGRNEVVRRQGWIDLHVVAEHTRSFIVHRVRDAHAQRGYPLRLRPRS